VELVLDAVGLDQRIGRIFMDPGVGYGGSCFPKDVKALISTGKLFGINTDLLEAVDTINEDARVNLLNKVLARVQGKKIAIWGLSFKPNTDDIRFAPSVDIIKALLEKGYSLSVYDQEGMPNIKKIFGDKLTYVTNAYDALPGVDALVILTDWNEFKNVDLNKVKKLMKQPLIFDGRNIYDLQTMKELGFNYISTGRASISL
jgi:UDPglucose 6-dehydrogenase